MMIYLDCGGLPLFALREEEAQTLQYLLLSVLMRVWASAVRLLLSISDEAELESGELAGFVEAGLLGV